MNGEQSPSALKNFNIFLMQWMNSQLGAVGFIFGERGKVDEADGFIGRSGEIGRHEISKNLTAAFAYGNLLIEGIFFNVRQLIGVNCVTQKTCDQNKFLQAQCSIAPPG